MWQAMAAKFEAVRSRGNAVAVKSGVALVGALGSVAAFAQSTTATAIDDTAVVAQINTAVTTITDVGLGILGVCAVAFTFRIVKGFIGR